MIYAMFIARIERAEMKEATDLFESTFFENDKKILASVGGKFVGAWTTSIGSGKGEFSIMLAFPSLAAYEEAMKIPPPEDKLEAAHKYMKLAKYADYKIMVPTSWSPAQ